jgi:hypothetical protein
MHQSNRSCNKGHAYGYRSTCRGTDVPLVYPIMTCAVRHAQTQDFEGRRDPLK